MSEAGLGNQIEGQEKKKQERGPKDTPMGQGRQCHRTRRWEQKTSATETASITAFWCV